MKRQLGFTLVEILVVLAIIAMLLAILLPGLAYSRQLAYRITCLNNLKQLGVAVEAYVQTYGFYPVCVPAVNESWSDFLADKSIAVGKELGVPVSLWPFHQTAALYNCPILSRMDCDISYCYNASAGAKVNMIEIAALRPSYIPPPKEYETKYHLLRPQEVKSPAMFILLYDQPLKTMPATDDYNPYKDIDPDDEDNRTFLWRYNDANAFGPHIKGHSILFGDNHVEWYKRWSDSSMSRSPQ